MSNVQEIMFCGKRIDTHEQVYGYLTKMWGQLHIVDINDENSAYPVIPETVGQYSGLRDKTGREIYKPDKYRHPKTGLTGVVIFEDGCFFMRWADGQKEYLYLASNYAEYIGDFSPEELFVETGVTNFGTQDESDCIIINRLLDISKDENFDNLIDIIIDVDVSDAVYERSDVIKEECRKDAWAVWVIQDSLGRQKNKLRINLCNEGFDVGLAFSEQEITKIIDYIKSNNIDSQAGILLNESTRIN